VPQINHYSKIYNDLHEGIIPQRKFKRGSDLKISTLLEDAYCTLAEFGRGPIKDANLEGGLEGASTTVFQPDNLEELGEKKRLKVSTKIAKKIFEEIDVQTAIAEKNLRELETQLKAKEQELAEAEADYAAALRKEKEVEEIYKRFTPEEIEEARTLMAEVEAMKKREQEFKDDAEAELEAIRQEILAYENPEEITEEQVREMEEKLAAERLRLAEVNDRKTNLMEEKTRLTAEYNELNDQRREFNRLVERMKEECERNQQLRRLLTQLEREEAAQQNVPQS
ncbi:hypothetical protein TELCIR_16966, partial [Teladorsagia circumcincta]